MKPLSIQTIRRVTRHFPYGMYHGYSFCKLRTDPVYAAVAQRLLPSDLPLIDLGCGLGLCAFSLREQGFTAPVYGVDRDQPKIAMAQRLAQHYPPATFRVLDALDPAALQPPHGQPGHIVMLDVLHYFPPEVRRELLERIGQAVAPGGWAIFRTSPASPGWRHGLVRLEEWLIHKTRWMKVPAIAFPTIEEITEPFAEMGFSVEVRPLWGKTPFNSHLFAFRKPG